MNRNVPSPTAPKVSLLPTGQWTLNDARQYLQLNRDDGVHCPACDQFVKVYRRRMYGAQVRTLIYAYRQFGQDFFHLSVLDGKQVGVRQADFPKLEYWALIEKHHDKPHYRITDRGVAFIERRLAVPETIVLYDGHLQGFEGVNKHIDQVLPKQFDYQELMS